MFEDFKIQVNAAVDEAELLKSYAAHLESAAVSENKDYKIFVLDENLKLWVDIEASMKNKDKLLPQEIKDNLIKLSKYVEQKTIANGVDMKVSDYKSLAEINRQISEGLLEAVSTGVARQGAYHLAKSGLHLVEAHKNRNKAHLVKALDNNQRLWVMIKTLVNTSKSNLPQETKNNLSKLADYVANNTIKVGQNLDDVNVKMLDSFVNINRHISEGLLGHC